MDSSSSPSLSLTKSTNLTKSSVLQCMCFSLSFLKSIIFINKGIELCIERGKHSFNCLENPFLKGYWENLENYHGNSVYPLKRFWNELIDFTVMKDQETNDIITISQGENEWNPFLIIEYSFLDYSEKLQNKEIFFINSENSLRDLNAYAFKRKLIEILNIEDGKFSFSIPEDVKQRINDLKENKWTDVDTEKKKLKPLKKKKGERLLSVLYVGSLLNVIQLKETYLKQINTKQEEKTKKKKFVELEIEKGEQKKRKIQ